MHPTTTPPSIAPSTKSIAIQITPMVYHHQLISMLSFRRIAKRLRTFHVNTTRPSTHPSSEFPIHKTGRAMYALSTHATPSGCSGPPALPSDGPCLLRLAKLLNSSRRSHSLHFEFYVPHRHRRPSCLPSWSCHTCHPTAPLPRSPPPYSGSLPSADTPSAV